MADIQVIHPPNGGKAFWQDFSKKTGTWSAVAALAAVVEELTDDLPDKFSAGWEHVAMVIAAAVVRSVIGLIQGKVGDPAKASFTKAPDPDDDLGD